MQHTMAHDLPPVLARKAAERAFAAYQERYAKYEPRLRWVSATRAEASFSAKGLELTGRIELRPGAIAFDLEVPLVLRLFKRKAIAVMERELRIWTERAKRGEI